jgi:hypothetical protein
VSRLIALGFSNGNAQRLLGGETSIGANLLQQVAEVFEVQPWQLLVPGLDPAEPPGLTADSTAWPFPLVDCRAYQALSAVERAYVQGALANAIADRIGKRLSA